MVTNVTLEWACCFEYAVIMCGGTRLFLFMQFKRKISTVNSHLTLGNDKRRNNNYLVLRQCMVSIANVNDFPMQNSDFLNLEDRGSRRTYLNTKNMLTSQSGYRIHDLNSVSWCVGVNWYIWKVRDPRDSQARHQTQTYQLTLGLPRQWSGGYVITPPFFQYAVSERLNYPDKGFRLQ